jgi:hypothetical protein
MMFQFNFSQQFRSSAHEEQLGSLKYCNDSYCALLSIKRELFRMSGTEAIKWGVITVAF